MYYLECQCKYRNVWNEVDGVAPMWDFNQAVSWARIISNQRRTPTRVVDDQGAQVWP
jgi:hypothetical protein